MAQKRGGSVYTIAPVNDNSRTRQVHHTLLKAAIGVDSPNGAPVLFSPTDQQQEDESSCDRDLFVLRHQATGGTPIQTAAITQTNPWLLPPQFDPIHIVSGPSSAPTTVAGDLPSVVLAVPPAACSDQSGSMTHGTVATIPMSIAFPDQWSMGPPNCTGSLVQCNSCTI